LLFSVLLIPRSVQYTLFPVESVNMAFSSWYEGTRTSLPSGVR